MTEVLTDLDLRLILRHWAICGVFLSLLLHTLN